MGYVNVTDICKFISPFECGYTAGTWTPTISSNLISNVRSAADAGFTILIPIKLPGSVIGNQAAKILSVDIWYKIGTAALDDFAYVSCDKVTLSANAAAVSGASYNASIAADADNNTGAERKTVASHKLTLTFSAEPFIGDDEVYWISLVCDAAATSVFEFFGAQANFEIRL